MKKDFNWIKEEIKIIKKQVFNDIPHKICQMKKELNEKVDNLKKEFADYRLSQAKFQVGILVSIVLLLIGIIANIIISLK